MNLALLIDRASRMTRTLTRESTRRFPLTRSAFLLGSDSEEEQLFAMVGHTAIMAQAAMVLVLNEHGGIFCKACFSYIHVSEHFEALLAIY